MRPITDRFKVARVKLAYIIDATAAPVCILAPVSSWAAAVGSSLPEGTSIDGFSLFLHTIPVNLYAILTLMFMLFIVWSDLDFATMAEYIRRDYQKVSVPDEYADDTVSEEKSLGNGTVLDLILPIFILIGACVFGMLYTGGILEGKSVADAFADCDSAKSLVLGSFITFVFIAFFYLLRGVLQFDQFCECFTQGFKAMVPAIFILCLAWTMSGIVSAKYLNLGGYVGHLVQANSSVGLFLPAIFFVVAGFLAFSTGTSWGTFGILIPIAVAVVGLEQYNLLVLLVTATLSGAVAGDHASPISDTTILASAGAQCKHLDHVSTQIPYVMIVSCCSFLGYIVDGFTMNGFMGLGAAVLLLALCCVTIRMKYKPLE